MTHNCRANKKTGGRWVAWSWRAQRCGAAQQRSSNTCVATDPVPPPTRHLLAAAGGGALLPTCCAASAGSTCAAAVAAHPAAVGQRARPRTRAAVAAAAGHPGAVTCPRSPPAKAHAWPAPGGLEVTDGGGGGGGHTAWPGGGGPTSWRCGSVRGRPPGQGRGGSGQGWQLRRTVGGCAAAATTTTGVFISVDLLCSDQLFHRFLVVVAAVE